MTPLTVVCWKWTPPRGYRSEFRPATVRTLQRMVARHYPHPHRFVCITDDPAGLDGIETIPLWDDYAGVPNPHGAKNPSCYRRLKLFAPEIGHLLGPRVVSLDLDCVILGDLTPLWNRPDDFVCWGDTNKNTHYNGSMMLLTAGARPQVWTTFDPQNSPRESKAAGCFGSDQGWISYCLGPNERKWSQRDGVYSFRNDIKPVRGLPVPAGARVVFFHGNDDPWSLQVQSDCAWVREHYQ